jgi:hypothetical protein
LLDLTGLWPTRTGSASSLINNGPRPRTQRWSRAFHAAYPHIHGLYYRAAMSSLPAVALYERAKDLPDLFPPRPSFHRSLGDRSWLTALRKLASQINYRIAYPLDAER